jgi:hypothetical protein
MSVDPILKALADCNPNEALQPDDYRFADLDDIRGTPLRLILRRLLQAADSRQTYAKLVVAGHRGSGKSTELNRAQVDLKQSGYETLWASVNENLDPREISFSDIIRLIVLLLDDRFGQETHNHPSIKRAFDNVRDWYKEVAKTFTAEIDSAKELGMKARIGGPATASGLVIKTELGELSAAISVVRRSESKERTEIRETFERYNNELVDNLNSLVRAVTEICCPGKSLVVILDNVDKYEPAVVNEALLRNSELLREVDCHVVFTVQSSLLYKPVEDAVDQCFTKFDLPMLPIFVKQTREPNGPVVERIREAVYKRVPQTLFADEGTVNDLIQASGGCWRDLLRLLQEALLRTNGIIGPAEVKAATQQVAQTYRRLLRSREDLLALARVHLEHNALSDEETRYLLHHLCILAYNGEGWYDIHPLLDNYAPVKEAVRTTRAVT